MGKLLIIFLLSSICVNSQIDDKTKHFYAGFGITVISAEITNQLIEKPAISSAIGGALGITATILKEVIYDGLMNRGTKSFADGMVGCFGSATGAMVIRVRFDLQDKKKNKALYYYEWGI